MQLDLYCADYITNNKKFVADFISKLSDSTLPRNNIFQVKCPSVHMS